MSSALCAFGFAGSAGGGAADPAFAFLLSGTSSGGFSVESPERFGGGGAGFVRTSAFGTGTSFAFAAGGLELVDEVDDGSLAFLAPPAVSAEETPGVDCFPRGVVAFGGGGGGL